MAEKGIAGCWGNGGAIAPKGGVRVLYSMGLIAPTVSPCTADHHASYRPPRFLQLQLAFFIAHPPPLPNPCALIASLGNIGGNTLPWQGQRQRHQHQSLKKSGSESGHFLWRFSWAVPCFFSLLSRLNTIDWLWKIGH